MKKGIIAGCRLVFCAAASLAGAAWGEDLAGTEPSVDIDFQSIGIGRAEERVNGCVRDAPFGLSFWAQLSVRPPLWLVNPSLSDHQFLQMTDSSGRKLSRVCFDLGLNASHREGDAFVTASLYGKTGKMPRPDVFWVRLKGTFQVPVARLRESPVYELPLKAGVKVPVLLQDDREEELAGDVAVLRDAPRGEIFLREYDVFEEQGRKMARVEISLTVDRPMKMDSLQILDDRGTVMSSECLGERWTQAMPGFSRSLLKRVQVEYKEGLEKVGVRFHYISRQDVVPVPVNVKLGMAGEIQGSE